MSIVHLQNDLKPFLNIAPADTSKDHIITPIHNGIENHVAKTLKRTLESTTYSKRFDGSGTTQLLLEQYPVSSITRVSISFKDVIKTKNTSSDVDNCYVTVDSDSLLLTISGGANNGSDDLTFASYATMSAMVTQINATAKGWDAAIIDTDYNDLKTSSLLEVYNLPCGAQAGKTATYQYLYWGEPIHVTLNPDTGIIYYSGGFPKGFMNILVNYTAGYSAADMPETIKLSIMNAAKAIYTRWTEDGEAVTSFSIGNISVKYKNILEELNSEIEQDIDPSKSI